MRYFTDEHEWIEVDGDVATVGITDFAQSELGDVVYVELPEVGSEVAAGETYGVVESVKAASDVYSPVSGEVVEVNEALVDDPSKVNSDAFGGGWMFAALGSYDLALQLGIATGLFAGLVQVLVALLPKPPAPRAVAAA